MLSTAYNMYLFTGISLLLCSCKALPALHEIKVHGFTVLKSNYMYHEFYNLLCP